MGDTQYFWTAWAENSDGDTREIEMQGDDIRDYTVTEAGRADILGACGVAGDDTLTIERDCDGRAYIFNAAGEQLFAIESSEICGMCGHALESCEGACTCDSCGVPLADGGDGEDGVCSACRERADAAVVA